MAKVDLLTERRKKWGELLVKNSVNKRNDNIRRIKFLKNWIDWFEFGRPKTVKHLHAITPKFYVSNHLRKL